MASACWWDFPPPARSPIVSTSTASTTGFRSGCTRRCLPQSSWCCSRCCSGTRPSRTRIAGRVRTDCSTSCFSRVRFPGVVGQGHAKVEPVTIGHAYLKLPLMVWHVLQRLHAIGRQGSKRSTEFGVQRIDVGDVDIDRHPRLAIGGELACPLFQQTKTTTSKLYVRIAIVAMLELETE